MKRLPFKTVVLITLIFAGVAFFGFFRAHSAPTTKQSVVGVSNAVSITDIGAEFSSDAAQPFTFSTGNLPIKITQHAISPARDADYILTHYKACGPKYRPKSYFPETAQTMRKLPETAYSIGTFQIILMPNLLGYKNFPAVQEDFFACSGDTGVLVPAAMNDSWLVFTRSCADTDEDCKATSAVVASTIQVK